MAVAGVQLVNPLRPPSGPAEDLDVGVPEGVDRLLGVAHHHQPHPQPRKPLEDPALEGARVLVLVDEDPGEAALDAPGQRRVVLRLAHQAVGGELDLGGPQRLAPEPGPVALPDGLEEPVALPAHRARRGELPGQRAPGVERHQVEQRLGIGLSARLEEVAAGLLVEEERGLVGLDAQELGIEPLPGRGQPEELGEEGVDRSDRRRQHHPGVGAGPGGQGMVARELEEAVADALGELGGRRPGEGHRRQAVGRVLDERLQVALHQRVGLPGSGGREVDLHQALRQRSA